MAGKYDVNFDPNYTWDPLYLVVKRIKENSTVLEFGPANGRLTKYLQEQKRCTVDIVEYDMQSGTEAAEFSRYACLGEKNGNIELDFWVNAFASNKYDYIIFADVLEHLRNPEAALKKCKQFLKTSGEIIISIPNVAHNAIVLSLLDGKFPYMDTGLLDRTHVFFFTKETILTMLRELGYLVYYLDRITRKPEDSEFKNTYNEFSQEAQSVLKFREEGETYQYVISCGIDKEREIKILPLNEYSDLIYQNILRDKSDSMINIYPSAVTLYKNGERHTNNIYPKIKDNIIFLVLNIANGEKICINFFTGIPIIVSIEKIVEINSRKSFNLELDSIQGNFYKRDKNKFFFYTLKPYIIIENTHASSKLILNYRMEKLDNITVTRYFDTVNDKYHIQCHANEVNLNKIHALNHDVDELNYKVNILQSQLITQQNKLLQCENEKKDMEQSFLNSKSWKLTAPLRQIKHTLFLINNINEFKIFRSIYLIIPATPKTKDKLKNIFYSNFGFLMKNQIRYQAWLAQQNGGSFTTNVSLLKKKTFTKILKQQPGKIAIHIHLYYTDLLEEFCQYLSNMPYEFDVLISIVDEDGEKEGYIKNCVLSVAKVENCIIRVLPNRGRDVAPFFVGFGDLIGNYEFIAHVHTKKSLYTGTEQTEWRDYLLDQLLGNKTNIMKIFWEFKMNPQLGLLYPAPSRNIPYVAFTWLSNKVIGLALLNKLGIDFPRTTYFDYSAGTMFWARTSAIKKLYSGALTLDDFPKESGQTDGTIAHAIERIMCMVINSEGMDYYETNFPSNSYTVNCGSKNLWQYYSKNIMDREAVFSLPEVISFDIFDTLIMRNIAKPEFVNDILELIIAKKLGINVSFKRMRLLAEQNLRLKMKENKDITLSQIYNEFSKITDIPVDTCDKIKKMEISEELRLCTPRKDMVEWFNYAKKMGKRLILVSDMYLEQKDVELLLKKCGIYGYQKAFISSQTSLRKDTKQIWQYFYNQNMQNKMIHIGDNERSDWQIPVDMGFNAYHIMSAINLFQNCKFGYSFFKNYELNVFSAVLLGPILSKKFNSPFAVHDTKYFINNFEELGYIFYGPILAYYILWLIKERNNYELVLFLARDGYFLKPLYEKMCQWLKIKSAQTAYFLASRRATSVASFNSLEEVKELLEIPYNGSIRNFFQARLGIAIEGDEYSQQVNLPRDKNRLEKLIRQKFSTFSKHARLERENYIKYIKSLNLNLKKHTAVVDMGYAGTIQHYLESLTHKEYTGYYFATNQKNWFHNERIKGCFANNENYENTTSAVFKYQLIFECILTSPQGQLLHFNEDGEPVYGNLGSGQKHIDELKKIHEGVEHYCKDLVTTYGSLLFDLQVDLKFFDMWTRTFVKNQTEYKDDIKEIYYIDDSYCNGLQKNVFDFYENL